MHTRNNKKATTIPIMVPQASASNNVSVITLLPVLTARGGLYRSAHPQPPKQQRVEIEHRTHRAIRHQIPAVERWLNHAPYSPYSGPFPDLNLPAFLLEAVDSRNRWAPWVLPCSNLCLRWILS